MDRSDFVGYWVTWPYDFSNERAEYELREDGRFEARISDEDGSVEASARGTWDIVEGALEWTYESMKGPGKKPRRPERDKILYAERDRFTILTSDGEQENLSRGVPCACTSTNFDLEEVQPFLERLAGLIDEGFGAREVAALAEQIKALDVETRFQAVFPITFQSAPCPLYVGVTMDDVDAPDICFSTAADLVLKIDDEINKL